MPIYAYKCESCGFAKDVLQKMSDTPLTDCPNCGASSFRKQLTAAGFQLKGTGWYVTDFRGGDAAKPTEGTSAPAVGTGKAADGSAPAAGATTAPAPAAAAAPAPAPAPAPAAKSSDSSSKAS